MARTVKTKKYKKSAKAQSDEPEAKPIRLVTSNKPVLVGRVPRHPFATRHQAGTHRPFGHMGGLR